MDSLIAKIMLHKSFFRFLLFLCVSASLALPHAFSREVILLNRDYKFQLGDPAKAEATDYDDASWPAAAIPHSFSTPYWGARRFHVGYGWYRKSLDIPSERTGKRVALDFEGVFQECEVYINGILAGKHQGGYTGFEVDITPHIKPGKNTMAVRVNNFWNPEIAPRAGEHVFSAGIYRDVRLVVTDPLHVTWYGTFAKTPTVSEKEGILHLSTEISNSGEKSENAFLETAILDPEGKRVAQIKSPIEIKPGETKEINQEFPAIKNPKLWHPTTPRLYKAVSRITTSGTVRDTYTTEFGFRWFEFTADKGFFLNGKHLYIVGANVHQDRAGWGDAVPNSAFFRDVKMIKEAGMNFIRGSHYPHDPAFSQACDELGILLWSEGLFWGIGAQKSDGYWDSSAYPPNANHQKGFEQSLKDSLRDMIRIHRNHPSIVIWSMGNEIFFTDKSVMNDAKECVKRLVEYSKQLDPTRPAGIGGVQRQGFDKLGDVAGYNGDGANVKNPTLPNLVAEYGSVISNRPGSFDPYLGHLKNQPHFPWRSGQVLWCGFHHGSIAGNMGKMGFIDYARLPLRAWYWYRENNAGVKAPAWPEKGTPSALSLTADRTNINADGTEDCQITISVNDSKGKRIDAQPTVTLTIESGPGIFPTGKSITFTPNVNGPTIIEGWAAVDFRSYYAGKTVIRATSPGLKDAKIELNNINAPSYAGGKTQEWLPISAPITEPTDAQKAAECAKARPASSDNSKEGHPPLFGNDDNPATSWQGVISKEGRLIWRLDLENFYALDKVTLSGLNENLSFAVEITADEGKTWVTVGDSKNAAKSGDQYTISCDSSKAYGRFLRVIYTGAENETATQAEISVMGAAR